MIIKEKEAIEKHVYIYNETILFVKDNDFDYEESKIMLDRMVFLIREHQLSFLLLDLSTGKRPNAQKVELIKNTFKGLRKECKYISIFTEKNILLNVAIQFVLGNVGIPKSVNKNMIDALSKIESIK